ncbi:MAG: DUF333 domain-containing protein, partial [Candidatus Micrarchaeota archaeon]
MKRILLLAVLLSAPLFALSASEHEALLVEKTRVATVSFFNLTVPLTFEKLANFGEPTQYIAVYRPSAGGYDITVTVNREPSNYYELANSFTVNGFTVKTTSGTGYGTPTKGLFYCKNPSDAFTNYPVYFDIPIPAFNVTDLSRALTQACLDYRAAAAASPAPSPTATPQPTASMPNPASVNCEDKNGTLEIRDETGGQVGYCHLADGTVCEEWAYYRNECPATPTPTPTAVPTVAPTVAPTIAPTATPAAVPSPMI